MSLKQKAANVNQIFELLGRNYVKPSLKTTFLHLKTDWRETARRALGKLRLVANTMQRSNLSLWRLKAQLLVLEAKRREQTKRILAVLLGNHDRLTMRRNLAWNEFKRPVTLKSRVLKLERPLAKLARLPLRGGFAGILSNKLGNRFQGIMQLLLVNQRKQRIAMNRAFGVWGRRGIAAAARRLALQVDDRMRHAMCLWAIRAKTQGLSGEVAQRIKGMSLLLLNKMYRRPFDLKRAFKRWSINW